MIKLNPEPTFKVPFKFPSAGSEVTVNLELRHMARSKLDEMTAEFADKEDADAIMRVLVSWDVDAELTRDNLKTFMDNYPAFGQALARGYVDLILRGKLGN